MKGGMTECMVMLWIRGNGSHGSPDGEQWGNGYGLREYQVEGNGKNKGQGVDVRLRYAGTYQGIARPEYALPELGECNWCRADLPSAVIRDAFAAQCTSDDLVAEADACGCVMTSNERQE